MAVSLDFSGGIAGFDRRVEVSPTGEITAIDRRRKVTRTAKLSAPELAEMHALVKSVSAADTRSLECRDCLAFELTVERGDTRTVVRTDDVGLARSGAAPAIRRLSDLLTRVLSGTPQ